MACSEQRRHDLGQDEHPPESQQRYVAISLRNPARVTQNLHTCTRSLEKEFSQNLKYLTQSWPNSSRNAASLKYAALSTIPLVGHFLLCCDHENLRWLRRRGGRTTRGAEAAAAAAVAARRALPALCPLLRALSPPPTPQQTLWPLRSHEEAASAERREQSRVSRRSRAHLDAEFSFSLNPQPPPSSDTAGPRRPIVRPSLLSAVLCRTMLSRLAVTARRAPTAAASAARRSAAPATAAARVFSVQATQAREQAGKAAAAGVRPLTAQHTAARRTRAHARRSQRAMHCADCFSPFVCVVCARV